MPQVLPGVGTFGPEPTVQAGFVRELFAAIKAGDDPDIARLTTFVDSNGHAPLARGARSHR